MEISEGRSRVRGKGLYCVNTLDKKREKARKEGRNAEYIMSKCVSANTRHSKQRHFFSPDTFVPLETLWYVQMARKGGKEKLKRKKGANDGE